MMAAKFCGLSQNFAASCKIFARVYCSNSSNNVHVIGVAENGKGMGHDDLLLCIERHVTSKIQDANDLNEVMSMGFQGETLVSIGVSLR